MSARIYDFTAQWLGAEISRLTSSWTSAPRPIDEDIKLDLKTLRARSREQAQNNELVRRFLKMVRTNAVGANGIGLQSLATNPAGRPDQNARTAIEDAWAEWGRFGSPEVTGSMSWRQLQRLVAESVARDGEVFLRRVPNWNRNAAGFALELIDPEYLDASYTTRSTPASNQIQMAVELDSYRRPVGYHVLTASKTVESYQGANGRLYRRIPAEQIYHLYLPEWIWQTRGVPWISACLFPLKQLDDYCDAALLAARHGAERLGYYVDEEGRYIADGKDSQGYTTEESEIGTFIKLPAGVTPVPWQSEHPKDQFPDFVKSQQRRIAAGFGVSYNALANDLEGVNYSSLRQGAIEERAMWMEMQDWLVESFLDRVFGDWLASALQRQAIRVRNRPLSPERLPQLLKSRWQPPRWPWVDPLKEVQAHREAIALGLRSRSEIIRESGRDPEEVWTEIEEEREILREMSFPIDSGSKAPINASETNSEPPADEDNGEESANTDPNEEVSE